MAAVVFTSPKTDCQYYLKLTLEETKAGSAYSQPEFSYKLELYSGGWDFKELQINAYIKINNVVVAEDTDANREQHTLNKHSKITILEGTASVPHDGSSSMPVEYNIDMTQKALASVPDITAKGTMPVTSYTKWSAVTSPAIAYKTTIVRPTDELNISWSGGAGGINTSISSYTLTVRKGSASGTVLYEKTGISSTQSSLTIIPNNLSTKPSRGDTLYATIQAISSVSGYNGAVNSNQVGRVNTLPAAPSASASGSTVTSASSIKFTVTAGADSDGQTRSLYYSLNGGDKSLFSSPLTIPLSNGLKGSNTISFYTYDGLEFSSATTQNFTAIFAPQIGSKSIIHTYVKDMNGKTDSLVSKTTITYSLSGGSASSIDIKLKAGSSSSSFGTEQSIPTAAITFNASSKTATININQIPTNILGYGQFFQIRFRLYDGTAYSDYTEWSGTGRRAKQPQLPGSVTFSNDAKNSQAKSNYFKSFVKVNATNSSTKDGYAQVTETIVIASYSNTSKTFVCSSVAGATIDQNLDLASITANTSVDFYFQTKDNLGQISKSSNLITLIKSPNLVYVGSSASVSITNLRPLSNDTNFIIYHSYGNIGNAGTIAYTYKIQIGSNSTAFTPKTFDPSDSDPNLRTLTLTAEEIKDLVIGVAPDQTSAHSASIIITATDGFGSSLSLSAPFTVNFTEPPRFSNTKAIKIKHDFSIGSSTLSTTTGIEVPVSISKSVDYDRSLQMFNAGEGIIFKLPRATDPNNDISEYLIYLARANVVLGQDAPNVSAVSFGAEPWIRIPYTTITKVSDSDYYYYRHNLPQFANNEYLYFKVKVVDKTGNESEVRTYDSCIIGCRTVQPNFNVSNIKITRNESSVNLEYKIQITDLGGSAPSEGWNSNYYNNYPNFERPGSATGSFLPSNYTPTVKLKIEIAPNQDFASNVISVGPFTGNSPLLSFPHTSASVSGFSGEKVYVRFTLSVSYGINSSNQLVYVNSTPQVYMQQGEIPTVAHRSHCVGINTKDLADEDILVIQNYLGKRYVILKNNDLNSQKIITVDLKEGTINGVIINGGSW